MEKELPTEVRHRENPILTKNINNPEIWEPQYPLEDGIIELVNNLPSEAIFDSATISRTEEALGAPLELDALQRFNTLHAEAKNQYNAALGALHALALPDISQAILRNDIPPNTTKAPPLPQNTAWLPESAQTTILEINSLYQEHLNAAAQHNPTLRHNLLDSDRYVYSTGRLATLTILKHCPEIAAHITEADPILEFHRWVKLANNTLSEKYNLKIHRRMLLCSPATYYPNSILDDTAMEVYRDQAMQAIDTILIAVHAFAEQEKSPADTTRLILHNADAIGAVSRRRNVDFFVSKDGGDENRFREIAEAMAPRFRLDDDERFVYPTLDGKPPEPGGCPMQYCYDTDSYPDIYDQLNAVCHMSDAQPRLLTASEDNQLPFTVNPDAIYISNIALLLQAHGGL